jgi:hypothetical protein
MTKLVLIICAVLLILLQSCSVSKPANNYQNHLKSTHSKNFGQHDNGGCGWHKIN